MMVHEFRSAPARKYLFCEAVMHFAIGMNLPEERDQARAWMDRAWADLTKKEKDRLSVRKLPDKPGPIIKELLGSVGVWE